MFKNILAFLGAVAVFKGFVSAAAQQFINNISIIPLKIKLDWSKLNAGSDKLGVEFPVLLTNNNPFTISMDSLEGEVWYGQRLLDDKGNVVPNSGLKLSNVFVTAMQAIDAGETGHLKFQFEVDISDTLEDAYLLATNGQVPITTTLWIYGYLNLFGDNLRGGVRFPIAQPINIIDFL